MVYGVWREVGWMERVLGLRGRRGVSFLLFVKPDGYLESRYVAFSTGDVEKMWHISFEFWITAAFGFSSWTWYRFVLPSDLSRYSSNIQTQTVGRHHKVYGVVNYLQQ